MTSQVDAAPEKDRSTMVGNYFVANYPPFSFWKPERVPEAHQALGREPRPDTPLGVYLHLPFCRQRCHFCYFRVYTGEDAWPQRVEKYVDTALAEMELYAGKPLIAGRKPRYVYFGGGTPSLLRTEQLERLLGAMKRFLPWDDVEEVTFECEPGTLHERKLRALRELGITRISLGVESFNDEVLKTNNRGHHSKHIYRAYDFVRDLGFPQVNIDLIAGMLNETEENWQEGVRKAVEMAPDCVTVYQMEITFNSMIYKTMQEAGQVVAPVADWPTKRRWVDYAFRELEKAGYTVTSGNTAVKDPAAYRFLYRDYLWRGADMVSLGVSSFGHLDGTHYQNEQGMGPYRKRVEQGELPIYRALTMNDDERLLRELILQMKLGGLDRQYFRDKFDVEILEHFAPVLEKLQHEGHLAITGDGVTLTRGGLLQVDELLHEFFLPEHRGARYT